MTDITTSLSFTQLQAATKAQIVSDIMSKMTRRELIVALTGTDKIVIDAPVLKYRKEDGQIESQTETFEDVETGLVVGDKQIAYTYYKNGEVDEITIVESSADGTKATKTIKHYLDGRQPEII